MLYLPSKFIHSFDLQQSSQSMADMFSVDGVRRSVPVGYCSGSLDIAIDMNRSNHSPFAYAQVQSASASQEEIITVFASGDLRQPGIQVNFHKCRGYASHIKADGRRVEISMRLTEEPVLYTENIVDCLLEPIKRLGARFPFTDNDIIRIPALHVLSGSSGSMFLGQIKNKSNNKILLYSTRRHCLIGEATHEDDIDALNCLAHGVADYINFDPHFITCYKMSDAKPDYIEVVRCSVPIENIIAPQYCVNPLPAGPAAKKPRRLLYLD